MRILKLYVFAFESFYAVVDIQLGVQNGKFKALNVGVKFKDGIGAVVLLYFYKQLFVSGVPRTGFLQ